MQRGRIEWFKRGCPMPSAGENEHAAFTGEGVLRVLSHSSQAFADRVEAGRLLADQLADVSGQNAVVLGIPRGGMVVARELAGRLDADLDLVLTRKLGAPGNPELAIGAISEEGQVIVDETLAGMVFADQEYIEQEKKRVLAELDRRRSVYRQIRPQVCLAGRLVVVTDDGVATGSTMQAALMAVRHQNPRKLICALPVGSQDAVNRLVRFADLLVCLRCPPVFQAVGRFYVQFDQTSDDQVLQILRQVAEQKGGQ